MEKEKEELKKKTKNKIIRLIKDEFATIILKEKRDLYEISNYW